MKIITNFKCIFEEIVPKLSVNFGNHNLQDSHKNQYPSPVILVLLNNNNNIVTKC